MTFESLYAVVGALLFVVGLHALILRAHLLRKILALNVMGSGVFLVIGALAIPAPDGSPDAVAQALVITGIVVAIAATALALALMQKLVTATGTPQLVDSGNAPPRNSGTEEPPDSGSAQPAESRGAQAANGRSDASRSMAERVRRAAPGSSSSPPPS